MFGKLGKYISRALTPKHGMRATRKKYLPKVAGGAALIGSGIAIDKTINAIEGRDEGILDYGADPVYMIDKLFSVLRLEDMHNGAKSGSTFGPAAITTWLMVALFVLGLLYPSLIIYRQLKRCYSKCTNKSNNLDIAAVESKWTSKKAEKVESVNINIPEEKFEKFEVKRPD